MVSVSESVSKKLVIPMSATHPDKPPAGCYKQHQKCSQITAPPVEEEKSDISAILPAYEADIGMTNFFETDSETETIYGQNLRPRLRLRPEIAKIRDRD